MKNLIAVGCAIALIVAGARAEDMWAIDGQVFVRTKGAETIKLSLVDVALFDAKAIAEDVEKKSNAASRIFEALQPFEKEAKTWEEGCRKAMGRSIEASDVAETHTRLTIAMDAEEKILGMLGYTHSGLYYFSHLPEPMLATKTDADGKFSFKVPNGSYVLAAASSRKAGKETEFYHWMVKIKVDADQKVMLANDNLSTSGSPDSMISTTEIGDYEIKAMEGGGLPSVEAFIKTKQSEQHLAEMQRQKELREQELAGYRQNPKAAQQKAVALYPDVGVASSPLNKEFVARMKRYQAEKKEFFTEPDWPIRLAKECDEDLSAKQPAKQ